MEISTWILVFLLVGIVILSVSIVHSNRSKQLLKQKIQRMEAELTSFQNQKNDAEQAKTSAEAANLAKNKYLSGISHELRTPLNVIMGYAQLLENNAKESDPNYPKYQLIKNNCEYLTHLIEGILEFSAIESGKLSVQTDTIDIHLLLNQINQMFNAQANQKNLKFEFQMAGNLPQFVKTDLKRLKQILLNLLSNAIKFTTKGVVSFNVEYRSEVASFVVKDTGCGISQENLDVIFQPFERITSPSTTASGTGLGLTIAKLLSELMGGELTVNSQLNNGSEFKLKLMLSAQSPAGVTEQDQVLPKASNQQKILIVDDIAEHRDLLVASLSPYGFDLLTASHVNEAQQLIKSQKFDLALLDVSMPDIDGWQLAEWLRKSGYQFPVIMVSANPRDNDPKNHEHHQAYLAKPIQIKQLLTVLNQILKLGWEPELTDTKTTHLNKSIKIKRKDRVVLQELMAIGHISGVETHLNSMYANNIITQDELKQLLEPIKQFNLTQFSHMITSHE